MGLRNGDGARWRSLERWNSMAFLGAAGLLAGSVTLKGLLTFADVSVPGILIATFALPGLAASLIGLLGTYPRLADRTPRLALAGLTAAAAAAVGVAAIVGWAIGATVLSALSVGTVSTSPPAIVFVVVISATALGFLLIGVASLRTSDPSRAAGLPFVAFAGTWIGLVLLDVAYGTAGPDWPYFVCYTVQPVILFAAGFLRRSGPVSAEHGTPSLGSAAD